MKNVSKRNKIILAIVGVVVVAVIGLVITQPPVSELFGTVTSITIKPSSSTIVVGQSATLSSDASGSNCTWISSNTGVVSITSSSTNSATVLGKGVGTATITEKCGTMASSSATVTVNPAPTTTPMPTATPAAPTITPYIVSMQPDTTKTFSTGDNTCTWSASGGVSAVGSNVGATFTVKSRSLPDPNSTYSAEVRATCAGGSARLGFTVAFGGGRVQ